MRAAGPSSSSNQEDAVVPAHREEEPGTYSEEGDDLSDADWSTSGGDVDPDDSRSGAGSTRSSVAMPAGFDALVAAAARGSCLHHVPAQKDLLSITQKAEQWLFGVQCAGRLSATTRSNNNKEWLTL